MTGIPYSFCHYCGYDMSNAKHTPDGITCVHCGETTWQNSIGVAVLIAPAGHYTSGRSDGIFIEQRGIAPKVGGWALPSGYIRKGESWEAAACREAAEEIGLICRYAHVTFERPQHVLTANSSKNDQIVVVGAVMGVFEVRDFTPNDEVLARDVYFPDDTRQLCFPIHRKALAMYWDAQSVEHNVQV